MHTRRCRLNVPLSMFSDGGNMIKTKKSDFMTKLEELLPNTREMTDNPEVVIFDGMAIVQTLPMNSEKWTFTDMGARFQQYTLSKAREISPKVTKIHIIFDKYSINGLKTETRKYRGDCSQSGCRNVDVRGELRVPKDWKMFLSNGQNKERLIQFYSGYMAEHACTKLKAQEVLLINGGKSTPCVIVTTNGCCNQPILDTNQEEADTVMILHAKYEADKGSTCIAIHSPDTDVLVLLLHHYRYIGAAHLYMSTGRVTLHTDGRRFIPVHQLIDKLPKYQLNIMLSVFCITRIFGKGKRRAFKLLTERASNYQPLFNLGDELLLSDLQRTACTRFVISLYGGSDVQQTLHHLRCIKAKSSVHPRNIPPTADSLNLHLQRCVIQLWIWRHAITAQHDLPPFTDFGYEIDEDGLTPKTMSQPAAAPELLNDLVCRCEICSETCVCFANRQPCTVACSCTENTNTDDMMCTNVNTLESVLVKDTESSDDE
ncbi:hypothetical protein MAR_029960 [Mya arenaria]|uniref:Tesmin/TSO1-like CXC domain-containing protein n=1 Tax=Mya arenaria TaxID=6604 RepID=A0ABY7DLP4_MYAAR|nr:hypothetical protein MAR_029960 [Mya arenaria]